MANQDFHLMWQKRVDKELRTKCKAVTKNLQKKYDVTDIRELIPKRTLDSTDTAAELINGCYRRKTTSSEAGSDASRIVNNHISFPKPFYPGAPNSKSKDTTAKSSRSKGFSDYQFDGDILREKIRQWTADLALNKEKLKQLENGGTLASLDAGGDGGGQRTRSRSNSRAASESSSFRAGKMEKTDINNKIAKAFDEVSVRSSQNIRMGSSAGLAKSQSQHDLQSTKSQMQSDFTNIVRQELRRALKPLQKELEYERIKRDEVEKKLELHLRDELRS